MIPYFLLIAALVVLDQVVKLLVRTYIPLHGSVDFIPHVMDFTYVQNTGMAFSLFREHTWILALLSAVVSVVLIVMLVRRVVTHPFGTISLSLVIAGAIGNFIDRAFFGYVTDMFRTLFMDFAVFNVADICIVVGGIAFCVYFLFFFEKYEKHGKKEEPHGGDPADG